jgi:hypothetical protein
MSESETTDKTGISDSIEVKVKGPGKQWAWRDKLVAEQEAEEAEALKDRKGPGPEWDTNEEGVYINRDEDE